MSTDLGTVYTHVSNIPIPPLEQNVKNFLDKTTLIYGESGTGKTFFVRDILYQISKHVVAFLLIAPRSTYERSYKGIIPEKCWKENMTRQTFDMIWQRQCNVTEIYNLTLDMSILQSLFLRCASRQAVTYVRLIINAAKTIISQINNAKDISLEERRKQINALKEQQLTELQTIYRRTIYENKKRLLAMNLSDTEMVVAEYMGINPRLLILVDDCTELLESWNKFYSKKEQNIFLSIMFKGRHNYITDVICIHDDSHVKPGQRRNAHTSIFTSKTALLATINKSTNGFSVRDRKELTEIGDRIFDDEKSKVKLYMKLCIISDDVCRYKYAIAEKRDKINLIKPFLTKLLNSLPQKIRDINDNPYIKKIKNNKKSSQTKYVS
jgi:hypothetical protein